MERAFTYAQLVEICDAVRESAKTAPKKGTVDLVHEHLIEIGLMFRVHIKLYNDSKVIDLGEPFDTADFWCREEARDYAKEYNTKHGWKANGVDYLEAHFYE